MNKNVKIAKELLKLAKNLVADENIADKAGKYENFTGKIVWKDIDGEVENATFELIDNVFWKFMEFEKGTWKNGVAKESSFEACHWLNGEAINCSMEKDVIFENGKFVGDGGYIYFGGTFKGGSFDHGYWILSDTPIWEGGKWIDGLEYADWDDFDNHEGVHHGMNDSPDKWTY